MLRLSKLADYATVLLVHLGRHDGLATAAALAVETGVPEPTVAKLLKGLATSGLVLSHRGARGGYRLAGELEKVTVAAVIAAVDGPIAITACCDGRECEHSSLCGLSGQWDVVNDAILNTLNSITLADMGRHAERLPRRGPASAPVAPVGAESPSVTEAVS
ncbi:SUF system Fe-S cluster assembly regulator [Gluconobacter kondonii]|uniref:SUF system Fe-S cluster assembly regulator n=1 Tax=Gluconobacter kondonii TaxID=941463 RepID=UPI001B8BA8A8|nr:SUF system Fe-S cluster assembly regulator [Gluconobacter kondonii]MBS1076811.1 SUF system Fe-S cluster assembly regulator [Gluconobacter kondonii]